MNKKAQELRDQSDEQLEFMLLDLDKELFELRNELMMTRKLEKSHLIQEKKKIKAKILTIFTERRKKDDKK